MGTHGNDLVCVLKAEIARLEGTPVWQQQLLIDDCELEDQDTLQGYTFEKREGRAVVTLARRDTLPLHNTKHKSLNEMDVHGFVGCCSENTIYIYIYIYDCYYIHCIYNLYIYICVYVVIRGGTDRDGDKGEPTGMRTRGDR